MRMVDSSACEHSTGRGSVALMLRLHLLEDNLLSDATKSGAQPTLTADFESVIRNCVRDTLREELPGAHNGESWLDREVRENRTYTHTAEQYRIGIAMTICDKHPEADPLLVQKEVGNSTLWQLAMHKATVEPRSQVHHTSPRNLTGMYCPRVSKRCDLVVPPNHVQAAEYISATPLKVDMEFARLLWKARGMLGKGSGFDRDTLIALKESFMPYRSMGMVEKTGGDVFYILVNKFCSAFRFYPDSRGTLHPSCDKAARSYCRFGGDPVFVKDDDWKWWTGELKQAYGFSNLQKWSKKLLSNPIVALLGPSGLAVDGVCPCEMAACMEYVRLHKLKPKDRFTSFFWESDMAHSGISIMGWRYGEIQRRDYDLAHPEYRHARQVWHAEMCEGPVKVHHYSYVKYEDANSDLKEFIQPCQYLGQWGPIFDIITGVEGCRKGFNKETFAEIQWLNDAMEERYGSLTPRCTHEDAKLLSVKIRKTFNNAFPWIDKHGERMVEAWKDADWMDRNLETSCGMQARMSRFRDGNSSHNLADDAYDSANPDPSGPSRRMRDNITTYRCEILSTILNRKKEVTVECDRLVLDTGGTSGPGRSTHFEDGTLMTNATLIDAEQKIPAINIHDAEMRLIPQARQSRRNFTLACVNQFGKDTVHPDAVLLRC